MALDAVKPPPGTVRVRVRVRGNGPPIGWAGEPWTSEWRVFDAYPVHIEDFRKDNGKLQIEWPEGFKFKDGVSPVDPTFPTAEEEVAQNSADAVTAAKAEAIYHATRSAAADHELDALRTNFAALSRDSEAKLGLLTDQVRDAEGRLVDAEKARLAAEALLVKGDTSLAQAIAHAQSEGRALADTVRAKADSEIATIKADCDALIAAVQTELGQLESENESLKAKLAAIAAAPAEAKPGKGGK